MRAFIWWLRSAFCKHEWKVSQIAVMALAQDGSQISDLPIERRKSKECTKCGWIWRQRL